MNERAGLTQQRSWFLGVGAVLAAACCMPAAGMAQDTVPPNVTIARYNFHQLSDMLLAYNPGLQAAAKNRVLAEQDIAIAKQRLNPSLTLFGQSGRIASTLGNPQQIGITQEVETAGKREKRTLFARLNYTQAQLDYQYQVWQTRLQLKQRYIALAQAEVNVLILQAQKKLLNSLVDIADKRFKLGAAAEAEVLQARLASRQLDPQILAAKSQLEQAKSDVDVLLGNRLPPYFKVVPLELSPTAQPDSGLASLGLPVALNVDNLYHLALSRRDDYLSLQSELAQAQQQIVVQKAQRVPNVQLTAGYQFAFNAPDPFKNNDRVTFHGPYASINVPLPIWNQFKAQVEKAQTAEEQTRLQLQALELTIRSDVEKAVSRLLAAEKTWREYDQGLLPDATEVVRLAQESYRYGKTGLVNVIVNQQTAEQIRQSFLQAIVEYQQAWLALEAAVGYPL